MFGNLHLQRCSGGVFTPPEVLWRCVYTSRGALEVCLHLQRCSGGVFTPPEVLWRCVYTSRGALEVCLHLQRCSGGVFTPPEVLWRCVYTSRYNFDTNRHLDDTILLMNSLCTHARNPDPVSAPEPLNLAKNCMVSGNNLDLNRLR
ncbi:hypothetical protein PCASD_23594 [Puccinia coronata f. sp. avenae]|uniref:Uncharacterized protein n=1 Tax=Puccinia coronata f. sp. avenae TaxID=200324 RepID=A0A2N5TUZ6_9BASI|nr:hypothetical protein PCASD_23594 [Puccinia coronata f. sp. avenae]